MAPSLGKTLTRTQGGDETAMAVCGGATCRQAQRCSGARRRRLAAPSPCGWARPRAPESAISATELAAAIPGRVTLAIDPRALASLAAEIRHGSILVTGSNGKGTTCRMLAPVMRAAGLHPVVGTRARPSAVGTGGHHGRARRGRPGTCAAIRRRSGCSRWTMNRSPRSSASDRADRDRVHEHLPRPSRWRPRARPG